VKLFEQTRASGRQQYAAIPSVSEPRLILPLVDKRTFTSALQIQNTAAPINRLKKFILGASYPLPSLLFKSQIISETSLLQELLVFVSRQVQWNLPLIVSGYCGTEGKNRKLTLQVMKEGGEILGYIKIGDNPDARSFMNREDLACGLISQAGLIHIEVPQSLFFTEWNGFTVSVQSNIGTKSKSIGYQLTELLTTALIELADKSSVFKGKNDYLINLSKKIDTNSELFGNRLAALVRESIRILQNTDFPLVYVHGDCVPYNVRERKNKLIVFDWEFFFSKGLLFFDIFHYLYQGHVQIHHSKPKEIVYRKIFDHRSNMKHLRAYADHFHIPYSMIVHFFRLYLAEECLTYNQFHPLKDPQENHFRSGLIESTLIVG